MTEKARLWTAYQDLRTGRISRRDFIQRAALLGASTPLILNILQTK